jgi:hypothetical protein
MQRERARRRVITDTAGGQAEEIGGGRLPAAAQ